MPNITAAELHALRDAAVAQQSSSGGSNRGSAPAGYTSSTAGKTKVLDPDSSAYAANVKDKYKETQQPWYIVQEESAKNADTSAHAQKEKDSYVTGNILYHQWEQQQKNLKADSSAHAQAEKDDEAEKNPLFHQWKTAFDRQQEQKAAANEYKINKLQKELDELDRNSAYITTTDQYDEYQNKRKDVVTQMEALGWKDEKTNIFKGTGSRTTEGLNSVQIVEYNRLLAELDELNRNAGYSSTTAASEEYEQRRKELLTQLHTIDKQAGREERTYDSRERTGAFFKSWGTGTGASYTNTAANVNEITTSAQGMEREIAELEAQASKAQTAYDEAVRQYGEAGATFEKNLLIDAQQKLEAKKAQYAGMEKERAYDSKAQAVSQNLYNTADKLLTQSEQEMAKAKYGTSAVGSFALDAAKTGLDIAADTAVSALGVPGLVNMAVRVYGSEAQQARLQGDDAQTAAAKGLKSALIEVATEKIAGPFEKAYGKTALSSTINKAVDKLNASGLLKWAADTMGEGFEEGMSDVLNIVADHMMGWDSGENSIWGDIAADKDEIMYDMLLGAFVGAFGATGNAIGTRANASPTAQEQTQVQQTAPVQTEATQQNVVSAEAVEQVSRVLENGRVNNSTANEIASTPTLADAFYEVTGIALEGSTAAKRETVKTTAREYAYAKQQTEQAAADIAAQRQQTQTEADAALAAYSQQEAERQAAIEAGAQRGQREAAARERAEATSTALPTAQNVKQGGSDALNSAVNYNSRETAAEAPAQEQKNTVSTQETEKKPLSMADYVDKNSSVWNNLDYNDTAAQTKAMHEAHERMTAEGRVVEIPESTQKKTAESFPDLRGVKKSERTPILKQKMAELKSDIRQFLNGLKGGSFEFEVNGNVLEAKLYDTGIKEVLEKITQDKANMLNHSDLIFDNAEYLYSLPDYDGNPNVYRWNYFYTPVQIGDSTVGVRIAVRDMATPPESQIYNWGIKKTPALDGGSPEKTSLSTGVSSAGVADTSLDGARRLPNDGSIPGGISSEVSNDISSDTSIPTDTQNVNGKFEGDGESAKRTKDGQYIIDGYANGISRERGVSKNVRTDAAMEKNLRESFNQSPEMYTQLSNKETLAKAKEIYAKGYEHARSEVEQAIARGKEGYKLAPEIAPLAKMVSNELTRRGEVETAHRIMADIALEATAAGQFNQAQRIMRNSDPQTALMAMEKLVEEVNAEFQKTNPKSKWEASLTETEKQQILSTDFTEDGAWESVYETVADRIGKEMPVKFGEKVTELRRMNMLLRPRTMIKNVASNIPMIGLRKGAETLSIGIQKALVKTGVMDESQRTRGWASDEQRQLAKDYYEANKADINGQSNKWDFKSILREHKTVFKGGAIEKAFNKMTGAEVDSFAEALRQTTYSLLESGDAPFVKSAFVDSLAQYCAAKGITNAENITPEAVQFATANAMEATFKNANVIAKSLNEIKRKSPGAGAALDILIPFTTTPANILQLTIDYSPAGFVKLATNADIASKIDAFSKASVGTALLALGYAARNIGWITGGEDDDKDKAALDRATGQGTYSIGGKVSYDWAQPVGSLLAIGAEISDAVKGQESWASAFLNSVYSAGDSILNVSVFQNILSVLKGKGTSATAQIIDAIMDGGITQLVPGIAGDIAKIIDGTVRSTYTGGNAFEDASAKALAMIPGMSKVLPESVNVKGETNTRGEPIERILNTLINPTTITRGERNAVDDELYRLMDVTGSKTFLPSVSPYKVEYGNDEYTMTGKEREAFQKTQGQTYYELAYSLLVSEIYKALSDDEKAATLNAIRDYALSEAKRQFIEGKNTEYTSATDGVNDLPDGANYFAMKQAFTAAGKSGATSETYNALDTALEYWVELSQPTQDKLRSSNLNVDALRYADAMGIGSQEWYGTKSAIMESSKTLGETDVAKAIAVYNSMEDASDEEIFNAMRTQLLPEDAKPNTTIRRIEAYNTVAGDKANLGEWLNLVAELHDADENSSISKGDVYAAWGNMGLGEKETYAGITRDDFYNIVKNGSKSYAVNEKYATQFDEVYAALVPSAEKTKNTLANSVSGHNTATEDTQSGTKQYYSPIDFLLAGTPYASYK